MISYAADFLFDFAGSLFFQSKFLYGFNAFENLGLKSIQLFDILIGQLDIKLVKKILAHFTYLVIILISFFGQFKTYASAPSLFYVQKTLLFKRIGELFYILP